MCDSDGGTLKQNEKGTREEAAAQRSWRFQNLHHYHHSRTTLAPLSRNQALSA